MSNAGRALKPISALKIRNAPGFLSSGQNKVSPAIVANRLLHLYHGDDSALVSASKRMGVEIVKK